MKVHVVFSLKVTGSFADDIIPLVSSVIGHLHDNVILLLRPEQNPFRVFFHIKMLYSQWGLSNKSLICTRKLACVADALNLLYTKGLDECVGRLQRRLKKAKP